VVLLLTGSLVLWRILAQPNLTPTSPLAWQQQDVGATGPKGTGAQADAGWVVQGAGADIWGGADAFHFVYVPWERDAELIARVVSVEKTDPWAKAGLMIRASLTETSPHAFVAWTPQKGATFIRRSTAGARSRDDSHQAMRMVMGNGKVLFQQRGSAGVDQAVDAITPQASPRWLRLVRQGNVFQGFDSADGLNWEWLGTEALDLPSKTFVGLAVSSHDSAHLCTAAFEQVSLNTPKVSSVAAAKVGTGDGLQATYYPSMDLSGKGIARIDPTVNFDWGWGAPAEGIGRNQFSVRWEGELEAQFTEPYAIHMTSDDRARVWLNGELLIDEWYEYSEQTSTALANLEAGKRYLLRVEYFENRGRALAKMLWSSPSTPQQVIPQSQFYSHLANTSRDGVPDVWKVAHGLDPADASAADRPVNGAGLTARQLYESGFEPLAQAKPVGDWLGQDIDRVGPEGSAALSVDTWTVQGSGADIWANADAFQFVYQPWRGDGQIVARVRSQDATDPWAKAGLMIRASLQADAPHVMLAATPEHGLALLRREAPAQRTEAQPADSPTAQPWLKLVRLGSVVSAFTSSDGVKWSWIDTESLAADDAVYIGLAVCSHDNSKLGSASFVQVAVAKPDPERPVRLGQGSGDGLAATYFDGNTGKIVSRVDPSVNFDWDIDCPVEGIGPDFFSVRWEGTLEAPSAETYLLHVLSDDGARLWLDDQLLIDGWSDHGALEQTAKVTLQAGQQYSIRLEYFERTGEAICRLRWSTPSIAKQPIPQEQLYSTAGAALLLNAEQPRGPSEAGSTLEPPAQAVDKAEVSKDRSTSASAPAITGVRTVESVNGSEPVARLGAWNSEASAIYAVDRRGWLEYELNAPAADIYRLEVEGTSHNRFDLDSGFYLLLSVDGEYLGRELMDASFGRTGTIQVVTP
jgi:regulation of enolase protein 1 (concanavalin A-like superfamily)